VRRLIMGFPPMSLSFDELLFVSGDGSPNGRRAKSGDFHIATDMDAARHDGLANCG